MNDSKSMYELGYAFANAGEANFHEDVLENRSKYKNVVGVVSIAFACELFLKCLLNAEGSSFEYKHTLSDLWEEYKAICEDDAKIIENSVMSQLVTDLPFEEMLQEDRDVFNGYRYCYESVKHEKLRNSPLKPQFLRKLCVVLCAYAEKKSNMSKEQKEKKNAAEHFAAKHLIRAVEVDKLCSNKMQNQRSNLCSILDDYMMRKE